MRKAILFYWTILFFPPVLMQAQSSNKHVSTKDQLWLGYFTQTRFSKRFGLWADVHFRTTDHFVKQPSQFLTHDGLIFYLSDNVRLIGGYTYSYAYPDGTSPGRPEHRPWQQIWWRQNYNKFQTVQWIRLEERYRRKVSNGELADGYNFNWRLRYNFSLFVPLKGTKMVAKTPFFAVMDEVFINFGKEIVYNYFDSNRFFIGLGYQFTAQLNCQLGYMNVFQQQATGNDYVNTNAIRLFVYQQFDLRKKKRQSKK